MTLIILVGVLALLCVGAFYLRRALRPLLPRHEQLSLSDPILLRNLGALLLAALVVVAIWLLHRFDLLGPEPPKILVPGGGTAMAAPAGQGIGGGIAPPERERTSGQPRLAAVAVSAPAQPAIPTHTAPRDDPPAPTSTPRPLASATETPAFLRNAPAAQPTRPLPLIEPSATPTPLHPAPTPGRPPPVPTTTAVPPAPTPPAPVPTPPSPPAPPTPELGASLPHMTPPQLLHPADGLLLEGPQARFAWQPTSELSPDASYVLEVWPYDGSPRGVVRLRETQWTGVLEGEPGIYRWRVRIVAAGESGDVEQAVSETFTFTWRP